MKKKFYLFALVVAGMALSACTKTGSIGLDYDESDLDIDTPWVDYSLPVTSVDFEEGQDNLELNKGETYEYQYSIQPEKAKKSSLKWSTSDESVAEVSQGVVTAKGAGNAAITVFNEANSFLPQSMNVKVNVPLKNISFEESTLDADNDSQYQLSVIYDPVDTTQLGVSWHSDNENLATVDENGLVTTGARGEAVGTVHITATSAYINKTISMTINVADRNIYAESAIIDSYESEVEIGHSFTIKAHAARSDEQQITDPSMTYYSTNSEVIAVDEDSGVAHALSVGTAEIYAKTSNNIASAHVSVEVFEVKVARIQLDQITLSNRNGRTAVPVTFTYETDKAGYTVASIPNFIYEIDRTDIVTVNENGMLYAVADEGVAVLTVTDTRSGQYAANYVNVCYEIDEIIVTGEASIEMGATTQLGVTTRPSGVPDSYFSFVSDNPDVATVDENGLVTGIATGEADITVSALDKEKVFKVTVKDPTPQHQYYVEGIGGEWTISEDYAMSPDLTDPNHYYLGPVHLTANTELKVYDYVTDQWFGSNAGYTEQGAYWTAIEGGNLLVKIDGDYYVDLYIQHDEGNHIKLYYNGNPDDPVHGSQYYVEGIGGDWSMVEQYGMKADKDDANHFYFGPVQLTANTELKVYDVVNDTWYGSTEGYTEQASYWTTLAGGNVKTLVDGEFYVDLYVDHGEGNHLKLYYTGGDEPPTPTYNYDYYLAGLGGDWTAKDEYGMTREGDTTHYYIENIELAVGDEIKVFDPRLGDAGYYGVASAWQDTWEVGTGGNLRVTVAGTYTVNFYTDALSDNYISLSPKVNPDPIIDEYTAIISIDPSLATWTPTVSEVSLYVWTNDGTELLGTWDECKGNLDSGSVQLKATKAATNFILYFTQNDGRLQTVDSVCDIHEDGNYIIDISNHDWNDQGKMTGVVIRADEGGGDDPVVIDQYTATINIDLTYFSGWDPAVSNVSLYVWTDDNTHPLGEWETCSGNLASGSVQFTSDKEVTHFILYFTQGSGDKQSIDLTCSIKETATYNVNLTNLDWSGDQMIGITIDKAGSDPEPQVTSYYLKGDFNEWKSSDSYLFTKVDDNHYVLNDVEIHANEGMKGWGSDNTWYGVGNEGQENLVAPQDGIYKVDLYLVSEYNNHLVLTRTGDIPGGDDPVDPPEPSTEKTFYFTNNYGWSNLRAYVWNNSTGAKPAEWPGVEMSYVCNNDQGQAVYSITIDTALYDYIIFNSGSDQTVNIALSSFGDNNACYISGGSGKNFTVGYWNYTA